MTIISTIFTRFDGDLKTVFYNDEDLRKKLAIQALSKFWICGHKHTHFWVVKAWKCLRPITGIIWVYKQIIQYKYDKNTTFIEKTPIKVFEQLQFE